MNTDFAYGFFSAFIYLGIINLIPPRYDTETNCYAQILLALLFFGGVLVMKLWRRRKRKSRFP